MWVPSAWWSARPCILDTTLLRACPSTEAASDEVHVSCVSLLQATHLQEVAVFSTWINTHCLVLQVLLLMWYAYYTWPVCIQSTWRGAALPGRPGPVNTLAMACAALVANKRQSRSCRPTCSAGYMGDCVHTAGMETVHISLPPGMDIMESYWQLSHLCLQKLFPPGMVIFIPKF